MDMSSYAPCIAYASKLSSCAAATPGFYSTDDLSAQAGCVCYTSSSSCGAETYTTAFDDYALGCQAYMASDGGYTAVADAMNDDDFYLGPYFCEVVDEAIASYYSTDGLPATVEATTCAEAGASSATDAVVNEEPVGDVAAFFSPADHGVLVRP
jgi:hypothetical protein